VRRRVESAALIVRRRGTARKLSQVKRILIGVSLLLLASVVAILVFWQRPIAAAWPGQLERFVRATHSVKEEAREGKQ
jgi:hypothetical protein